MAGLKRITQTSAAHKSMAASGGNGGGLGCGMGDTATKGSNDVFFICIRHVGETMQKR